MVEQHSLFSLSIYRLYLEILKHLIRWFTSRTRFVCSVLVSLTCYSNVNLAFLHFLYTIYYFSIYFKHYIMHCMGLYMAQSRVFIPLLDKNFCLKACYACLYMLSSCNMFIWPHQKTASSFWWKQEKEFHTH